MNTKIDEYNSLDNQPIDKFHASNLKVASDIEGGGPLNTNQRQKLETLPNEIAQANKASQILLKEELTKELNILTAQDKAYQKSQADSVARAAKKKAAALARKQAPTSATSAASATSSNPSAASTASTTSSEPSATSAASATSRQRSATSAASATSRQRSATSAASATSSKTSTASRQRSAVKSLIISSGDSSDADGFLTIPIYKETGADLVYFVNFSAIFNENNIPLATLGIEGCPARPRAILAHRGISTPAVQVRLDDDYYPINSSADFAIPDYIHKGSWYNYYKGDYLNLSPKEEGKNMIKYLKMNNNLENLLTRINDNEYYIKYIHLPTGTRYAYDKNAEAYKETRDGLIEAIFNMTVLMVSKIWNESEPKISTQKLHIIGWGLNNDEKLYHLNTVNPFAHYSLSDDLDSYAEIFTKASGNYTLDTIITEISNPNIHINTLPNVEEYSKCYIDFNGSFAFYDKHRTFMRGILLKNPSVYIMGGVHSDETPKTLSMFNLVRLSCATMNQLYHYKNTTLFFNDIVDNVKANTISIFVASNNYITMHDLWDLSGKDIEVEAVSILRLFKKHMNWIADSDTLKKILLAYYIGESKPIKIFDVPVAMKLAYDIKSNPTDKIAPSKSMLYCDYGATILSSTIINDIAEVKSKYLNYLYEKINIRAMSASYTCEIQKLEHSQNNIVLNYFDIKDYEAQIKNMFFVQPRPGTIKDKIEKLNKIFEADTLQFCNKKNKLKDISTKSDNFNNSLYNFGNNTVIMFSDHEGGDSFSSVSNSNSPNDFFDKLNKHLIIENGILKDIKEKTSLIYLGDLIDTAPHGITLMLNMLNMKKLKPNQVILIGGNRDYNKIRLADEHFMLFQDPQSNTIIPAITYKINGLHTAYYALVDFIYNNKDKYTFKYNKSELIENLPKPPFHFNQYKLFSSTLVERINRVYKDTFGAENASNFIFDELLKLKLIDNRIYKTLIPAEQDIYKAIAVSLFNMAASRKWDYKDICHFNPMNCPNQSAYYAEINGLYINYIQQCDICALFKSGDDYGYVSHAGLPTFEYNLTNTLGVSYELTKLKEILFGTSKSTNFKNTDLIAIIKAYKALTNSMKIELDELSVDQLARNCKLVEHFIHMSSYTKYFENDNIIAHHALSPIVGYRYPKPNNYTPEPHNPITFFTGGKPKRAYLNSSQTEYTYVKLNCETSNLNHIRWNVYGHQPRGIVPEIKKFEKSSYLTYNICMDISKIEKYNKDSFALFIIDYSRSSRTEKIYGRITSNTKDLDDMVIYPINTPILKDNNYIIDIEELEKIQSGPSTSVTLTTTNSLYNNIPHTQNFNLAPHFKNNTKTYYFNAEFLGAAPAPIYKNILFIQDGPTVQPIFIE
jgi:hypothetical protein